MNFYLYCALAIVTGGALGVMRVHPLVIGAISFVVTLAALQGGLLKNPFV